MINMSAPSHRRRAEPPDSCRLTALGPGGSLAAHGFVRRFGHSVTPVASTLGSVEKFACPTRRSPPSTPTLWRVSAMRSRAQKAVFSVHHELERTAVQTVSQEVQNSASRQGTSQPAGDGWAETQRKLIAMTQKPDEVSVAVGAVPDKVVASMCKQIQSQDVDVPKDRITYLQTLSGF